MDTSHAEWRRSKYSQGGGNNCVEVALNLPDVVAVRDSKDPDGPRLTFIPNEWATFVAGIKND